jgi:hypothetical protein
MVNKNKQANTIEIFKKCSCGKVWQDRDDFLSDKMIEIRGYQANFKKLDEGLFLFNHNACQTTMGFKAGIFLGLYRGPIYSERKTGGVECPGYCLHKDNLKSCPEKCECASIREIVQIIKDWPKK